MKMFKSRKLRLFLVALVTILAFLFVISFIQDYQFSKKSDFVKIEELTSNSSKYNNKQICTTGYYSQGFEQSSLAPLNNENESIWISEYSLLRKSPLNFLQLELPTIKKTKVSACGVFQSKLKTEYWSGFGHMGAYKYRITTNQNEDF